MGEERGRPRYYEDLPGFVPVCSVCGAEWHTAMMHAASSAAFDIEFFVVPSCNKGGGRGNDFFASSKPSIVSMREPASQFSELQALGSREAETDRPSAAEESMLGCHTRRSLRGFDSDSLLTVSPYNWTDADFFSDDDELPDEEDLPEYETEDMSDETEGFYEDEEEELKAALQRQGTDPFSEDDSEANTDTDGGEDEEYEEDEDAYEATDEHLPNRERKMENILLGDLSEDDDEAFVVPPLEEGDFSSDDDECDGGDPCWGFRTFRPVFIARTGRKFTLPKTAEKPKPKVVKQEDEQVKQRKEKEEKETSCTNEKQTKEQEKSENTEEPEATTETVTTAEVQEASIVGRCAFENCSRDSRIIRETDDRVEVKCSLKRPCVVWYHLKCWRLYDKATDVTTSTDKNHVKCVTPDCEGYIRTIRRFTRRSGDMKEHITEFRKSDYIEPVGKHGENTESNGSIGLSQSNGETNIASGTKKGKKKDTSDAKTTLSLTLDKQKDRKGIGETASTLTANPTDTSGSSVSGSLIDTCTHKDKKKPKSTKRQCFETDTTSDPNVVAAATTTVQSVSSTSTRPSVKHDTKHNPSKPQTTSRDSDIGQNTSTKQEQTNQGDANRTVLSVKNAGEQCGNMWESKTSLQQLKASLCGSSPEMNRSTSGMHLNDDDGSPLESEHYSPQKTTAKRTALFISNSPPRQVTPSITKTGVDTQTRQQESPTKTNQDGPKFVVSAPAFIPRLSCNNETIGNSFQKPTLTQASTQFLSGKPSIQTASNTTQFYVVPFPTVSPRGVVHILPSFLGWPFSNVSSSEEKEYNDANDDGTSEETEKQYIALFRSFLCFVDELVGKESPNPTKTEWKIRPFPPSLQPSPPIPTDFPPLGSSHISSHDSSLCSPQQKHQK